MNRAEKKSIYLMYVFTLLSPGQLLLSQSCWARIQNVVTSIKKGTSQALREATLPFIGQLINELLKNSPLNKHPNYQVEFFPHVNKETGKRLLPHLGLDTPQAHAAILLLTEGLNTFVQKKLLEQQVQQEYITYLYNELNLDSAQISATEMQEIQKKLREWTVTDEYKKCIHSRLMHYLNQHVAGSILAYEANKAYKKLNPSPPPPRITAVVPYNESANLGVNTWRNLDIGILVRCHQIPYVSEVLPATGTAMVKISPDNIATLMATVKAIIFHNDFMKIVGSINWSYNSDDYTRSQNPSLSYGLHFSAGK